jgi:hypothetical protein
MFAYVASKIGRGDDEAKLMDKYADDASAAIAAAPASAAAAAAAAAADAAVALGMGAAPTPVSVESDRAEATTKAPTPSTEKVAAGIAKEGAEDAESKKDGDAKKEGEEEAEEEEECGFCKFMKGGSCKTAFLVRLGRYFHVIGCFINSRNDASWRIGAPRI